MRLKKIATQFVLKSMDDSTGEFEGYASFFNNVDSAREIVKKGAFLNTISKDGQSVKILWNHNKEYPIGKTTHLYEDDLGLFCKGILLKDKVEKASEIYELAKENIISGLSVGMLLSQKGMSNGNDGIRYINDVASLKEISFVTFPSNPLATITNVKSIENIVTIKEFEAYLRDVGASRAEAKALTRLAVKGIGQREADDSEELLIKSINGLIHSLKKGI